MRAGTFFALSVAVVLGLGSAAAAKYLGFFDKKADPPPPVPVAEKQPEKVQPPMVLVAATNLFKGMTTTQHLVKVRPLRKDEEADYLANRKDYLPPTVTAVNWRVASVSVLADTPLTIKHFGDESFDKAEFGSLGVRIDPYMRGVNIEVEKNRAAGGLIQRDERVDVFLTSKITDGSGNQPFLRTAMIAKDVKVIAKRDSLQTMLGTNPEGKPFHFTLQANPYRAALIEFAATSGTLSLVPRPSQKSMGMMMGDKKDPKKDVPKDEAPKEGMPNFADPDSKEYRDENERVAQLERGELSIGTSDLIRVFGLPDLPTPMKRIETPPPPMKVDTTPPPVVVVNIKGVEKDGETVFGEQPKTDKVKPEPKPEKPKPEPEPKQRVYRFYDLHAKVVVDKDGDGHDADCPTCGKNKK